MKRFYWPCTHVYGQLTFCDVTQNRNDVRRRYVVKYIICEITLKQDKIWIIVDEIFRIVIIYMYITHSILHWFNYLIDLQTETYLAQNLGARPNTSGVLQLCKNYCARYHFNIMSFESFKLIKIRQDVYIWNLRCGWHWHKSSYFESIWIWISWSEVTIKTNLNKLKVLTIKSVRKRNTNVMLEQVTCRFIKPNYTSASAIIKWKEKFFISHVHHKQVRWAAFRTFQYYIGKQTNK